MTTPSFFGHMTAPTITVDELWETIDDFIFLGTEDRKNFTFPAIDFDDNSMLVLIFDGSVGVNPQFQIQVNNITTDTYRMDGRRIANGVETIIDLNGSNQFVPLQSIMTQSGKPLHMIVYFQLNKAGSNTLLGMQSFANSLEFRGNENQSGVLITNITSITSLLFSLSNFRLFDVGSRVTLYRVKRKL